MASNDTVRRSYRMESLANLSPDGVAQFLSDLEANGWRLAGLPPYSPAQVGDIAVIEPWALLYGLPEANDEDTCYCARCGAVHRAKGSG